MLTAMSLALLVFSLVFAMSGCAAQPTNGLPADSPPIRTAAQLASRAGQVADMAPYAYQYRADRKADENPPESWVLLMQYANLPYDKPVDADAPAIKKVLRGLMWEEVRPVRRVELSWPADAKRRPSPDDVALSYFDATDDKAHTWWNPRTVKEAGKPEVSADGLTYAYDIPVGTWAIVAAVRNEKDASAFDVPAIRALVPDPWKKMDLEIEWGFQDGRDKQNYGGRVEAYNGVLADVHPLAEDRGTTLTGPGAWQSAARGNERRGVRMSVLYIGSPHWPRVWPYHAQPQDVARTILTVWTQSGSFSFNVSDLEQGPILAPEYGFFVRDAARRQGTPAPQAPPGVPVLTTRMLNQKMDALPGVPLIRGWADNVIPWFGVNPTDKPGVDGGLTIPARAAAMHPGPDHVVCAGWRSPLRAEVRVKGSVAMGSAGGNGIEWSIVRENQSGRQVLVGGAIGAGGSEAFPSQADAKKLANVNVETGDVVSLVVGPKDGNNSCDTTVIDLTIAEAGGQGRVWSLAKDVIDNIHAGNPHADSLGNADVWRFYSLDSPQSTLSPEASEPPFRMESSARTAREFVKELAARNLSTIRQRVREHSEQTWAEAVAAMRPGESLPPFPAPQFEPAMRVEVPCEQLTAQWKLGAWHILRRTPKDAAGKCFFNDYPFGILASETYQILHALDLQGMHKEAAEGLDQWLRLPMEHKIVPGQGGHNGMARPDRPLGNFSDGYGCLTHAEGSPGIGDNMDGIHCMGPGAIMFALWEHFRLTGDMDWLKANAPRMKANAQWILRQRQLLAGILPGGQRLWCKGLQPAQVVTPDSMCMHMQFYETEAYYWLAVHHMAEMLALIDPKEGAKMSAEAEAYRKDLLAAIDRSIALTPVVPVRDGTYHSFIPFAPYVRGFASGAWGWQRCQGHVGAIYWDTVQSADPLVSPSALLSPQDPRVQGHLDVLEDRLLLENTKIRERFNGRFDPQKDWFDQASWQYQCGLERHANIHLAADDVPNFIRSMLNQYAVDIQPGEYTFREHTTGGPPDKSFEESAFLERFRMMLVMEEGETLWLARATPRAWLGQGKKISVQHAPTHFGDVAYEIVSDADAGRISATIEMPTRTPPQAVLLRLRHPKALPIKSVTVNGKAWKDFDAGKELVRLSHVTGTVHIEAAY